MARQRAQKETTFALERRTTSEEETQVFGEALGSLLKPGDVVALHGDLGSGKTTFIQGIVHGLGGDPGRVKSPTFVLVREYGGTTPVIHIDAYRLEGASSAAWLDVELLFSPRKVTLIEWAERVGSLLPPQRLELHLFHVSTNRRRIALAAIGPRAEAVAAELQQKVPADAAGD